MVFEVMDGQNSDYQFGEPDMSDESEENMESSEESTFEDEENELIGGQVNKVNQLQHTDEDEEDDDEAPDTGSLHTGREAAEAKTKEIMDQIKQLKEQIREKRKMRHEKNKLQQDEKRKRLKTLPKITRISDTLLDAVSAEQKTKSRSEDPEETFDTNFADDSDNDIRDDDSTIPLKQGVQVKTLQQEVDKTKTIAQKAADFRQRALYGGRINRMDSSQLSVMKAKKKQQHKKTGKW